MNMDEIIYPLARGDYLIRRNDNQVARVRSIWWDEFEKEFCVNMSFYRHNGDEVGRTSPIEGGPRNYEPAVVLSEEWSRIEKPSFPIYVPLKWVESENELGTIIAVHVADVKRIPFRKLVRRERLRSTKKLKTENTSTTDYNPDLEASTRRLSAQTLRDLARTVADRDAATMMIDKAKTLEAEADEIKSRW